MTTTLSRCLVVKIQLFIFNNRRKKKTPQSITDKPTELESQVRLEYTKKYNFPRNICVKNVVSI